MSTLKQQALFVLASLLSVVIFFFYQEDLQRFLKLSDYQFKLRLYKYGFSILINYALISLVYLVLRKTWMTLFVSQFIFFSLTFINIKKEQYLSASLVPSDFLLLPETFTAAPFVLKLSVVIVTILVMVICYFMYKKERIEPLKWLIPNALFSVALISFFVTANFSNNFSEFCADNKKQLICPYVHALPNTSGDWVGDHLTIKNMGYVSFFVSKSLDGVNTKIFKTEDIDESRVQQILNVTPPSQDLNPDSIGNVPKKNGVNESILPNIIFVMSEAHWDARQLDKSIPKNITPTIDRYQVNHFLSPSFGGGTANVEFEVLTSLNVMLNHNELAYVSKLKRPTYSLAQHMNRLGYDSTAMHNNGKYFYNRSAVYQNLGFNRFTSIENMVSAVDRKKYTNKGGWANDDLIYQSIHAQLQQSQDQPQFIYAITVENHFNYNDDRFGKDNFKITKDGISDVNKRQLNTYLSGMQRADQHFKTLIDEAKKLGRPTMIIFFGDHLPNLGEVFDQFGFYANAEEKAQKNNAKFFSTPLAVWSNFEINRSEFSNSASNSIIPAHFLAQKVLRAAHLPSSPYYDFMNSVQECYSQIHQTGSPSNQACDQQKIEILQQYKDLNMDVINGKNFSYELLKSYRIS